MGPSEGTNNMERVLTLSTEAAFPQNSILTTQQEGSGFTLVENGMASNILVSESDHAGIQRIAGMFQKDLEHVSGQAPELIIGGTHESNNLIIVGTVGQSTIIDRLAKEGKIDLTTLEGKWEQFLIMTVKNPMEGVDNALVIAGSDKRGT
ncbi:MAG: glycosyl hydrolase, partial [Flavobacteriaceae bacterium]|nr:glycosyl hydrolase [Flavobacteriaceae bacterium]